MPGACTRHSEHFAHMPAGQSAYPQQRIGLSMPALQSSCLVAGQPLNSPALGASKAGYGSYSLMGAVPAHAPMHGGRGQVTWRTHPSSSRPARSTQAASLIHPAPAPHQKRIRKAGRHIARATTAGSVVTRSTAACMTCVQAASQLTDHTHRLCICISRR